MKIASVCHFSLAFSVGSRAWTEVFTSQGKHFTDRTVSLDQFLYISVYPVGLLSLESPDTVTYLMNDCGTTNYSRGLR